MHGSAIHAIYIPVNNYTYYITRITATSIYKRYCNSYIVTNISRDMLYTIALDHAFSLTDHCILSSFTISLNVIVNCCHRGSDAKDVSRGGRCRGSDVSRSEERRVGK